MIYFSKSRISSAAGSIAVLFSGSFIGAGFGFLAQLILARSLDRAQYGALSVAFSIVLFLGPLASFGLAPVLQKAFGNEGWDAVRWIRKIFNVAIVLSAVLVIVVGLIVLGFAESELSTITILISSWIFYYGAIEIVYSKYQLEHRYSMVSIWQLAPHLGRLIVASALGGAGVKVVSMGMSVVGILAFFACWVVIANAARGHIELAGHGKKGEPTRQDEPTHFSILGLAWPFALLSTAFLGYLQGATFLVGFFGTTIQAASFNLAFLVVSAFYLIPSLIATRYLQTKLHIWANKDQDKFFAVKAVWLRTSFAAGIFVGLSILFFGSALIDLLVGAKYHESSSVLAILAVSVPFRFVTIGYSVFYSVKDLMRRAVWHYVFAFFAVMVFAAILVPQYGEYGGAWALVLAEIILFVGLYVESFRSLKFQGNAA